MTTETVDLNEVYEIPRTMRGTVDGNRLVNAMYWIDSRLSEKNEGHEIRFDTRNHMIKVITSAYTRVNDSDVVEGVFDEYYDLFGDKDGFGIHGLETWQGPHFDGMNVEYHLEF